MSRKTAAPVDPTGFRYVSANEMQRHYKKQSVEVPNSKIAGSTGVYRSSLCADKLVSGLPDATSVYEGFEHGYKLAGPKAPCLGHRERIPGSYNPVTKQYQWTPYIWETWEEVYQRRLNFGSGLIKLYADHAVDGSVDARQWHFGVYSINRPEWIIADAAGQAYSLVPIPLFDTLGPDSVEYIVNHATLSTVVTSLDKVINLLAVAERCPCLKVIISMDPLETEGIVPAAGPILKKYAEEKGIKLFTFKEVEELGKTNRLAPRPPKPDDLYTICYTSGTTGKPKGVMTTHANMVSGGASVLMVGLKVGPQDVHISYLPLAHSYERLTLAGLIYHGVAIAFYRGDVTLLFDDIATVKPTIFCSVPRLYNRIYAAILAKTVNSGSALKAALFKRALESKKQYMKANKTLTHPLYDRLVFNKIKMVLGGRIHTMVSGSAPISPEVLSLLRCCFSCEVLEGYGLTETTAASSLTWPGDIAATGTIGPVIPCVEVKLVDIPDMNYLTTDKPHPRGEICLRGNNIMKGYYKDPEKTADALDQDGWLRTGDVGTIDGRGILRILDRKKHIFKLSQGEFVAPEKLENMFLNSPYIAQIFVHGDSLQSDLVAIAVAEPEYSVKQAIKKGILPAKTENPGPLVPGQPALPEIMSKLSQDERFQKLIMDDMVRIAKTQKLAGFEIPKAIYLEGKELMSIDNGLLTPTLKLKREAAKAMYRPQIDEMYVRINAGKANGGADAAVAAKL
ncbi:Long chain acyl-CoA synthetase 7 peroxisomal [Quaeritorhiza haematococci]|nr:Long chain acyl-CoA synthetase 7 peroxisomal [Quaeritorhiza haematococci]